MGQADGHQTDALLLSLDAVGAIINQTVDEDSWLSRCISIRYTSRSG